MPTSPPSETVIPTPVPQLDLKTQHAPLREEILARLTAVMDSQMFILGPEVAALERAVATYTGAADAVGLSSGTDAQLALLMALEVGPGDAVICPPYTFFATAGCVARLGATPVFVDILPDTFNLDPAALRRFLQEHCRREDDGSVRVISTGARLRAIHPVHLFGQCARMDEILPLAAEYALPVLEDAAQALGTEFPFPDGRNVMAGAIGEAGWQSFYPTKNLGAFGDAGMVTCRDPELAEKIRWIRNHGMNVRYHHKYVGGNFRMDALQAAVLNVKLPHLDTWGAARRRNARLYRDAFAEAGISDAQGGPVILPKEDFADRPGATARSHIYNQFVVRVPERDAMRQFLNARKIGHEVYYPLPLHLQECFAGLGHREGDFPESERAARESLALPIYPEMAESHIATVVNAVRAALG